MDVKSTILTYVFLLLAVGIAAIGFAVYFGKRYNAMGGKKNKVICVGCSVLACVCIMTAGQIILMFRQIL